MIDQLKDDLQRICVNTWFESGCCGSIVGATGVGKSRIPILILERLILDGIVTEECPALLAVPTELLRDVNWPEEFAKWGMADKFKTHVKAVCYASLVREQGKRYSFAIFDEGHWITENNSKPFQSVDESDYIQWKRNNFVDRILVLTATFPNPKVHKLKHQILTEIAPVIFTYTLAEGVHDGLLPDFEVVVIPVPLNSTDKVIPAGTRKKPFMTTELAHYTYLNTAIRKAQMISKNDPSKVKWAELLLFQRSRFLSTLPSKEKVATAILKSDESLRSLVFCGSIEQADRMFQKNVYHSKAKKPNMLEVFNEGNIDCIGVVDALNEGQNIKNLDQALNLNVKSNERIFIQRLGRLLRKRPNYKPKMYLIAAEDTQEMNWVLKVLESVPKDKVRYESFRTYV